MSNASMHGAGACGAALRIDSAYSANADTDFAIRIRANDWEAPLFPGRFIRIPALGLEFLRQRIDRAIVVLRIAFLVGARLLGQIEFRAGGFVRRRNDGIADPQ